MILASIVDVKAKLSEYLERAARGERILICRHNKPVAELRPVDDVRVEPRPIGPLPQRPTFEIPPAFFEPMSDDDLKRWESAAIANPPLAAETPRADRNRSKVAERRAGYQASGRSRARRRKS